MEIIDDPNLDYFGEYIHEHPDFTGCVIDADGDKAYFENGKLHRKDGPAIEWADGSKTYYKHDLAHREDGPAFEANNGNNRYFINNKELSYREWSLKTKLKRIVEKLEDENS